MSDAPKLDIYFDGGCAFCRWWRARLEPWDRNSRLQFVDFNDPNAASAAPFSLNELAQEMHLRAPDGAWSAGFPAWVRILHELPRLAWLGWFLAKPPLRWIGPGLYRWIARHRTLLPGAPPPCNAGACAPPTPRTP